MVRKQTSSLEEYNNGPSFVYYCYIWDLMQMGTHEFSHGLLTFVMYSVIIYKLYLIFLYINRQKVTK